MGIKPCGTGEYAARRDALKQVRKQLAGEVVKARSLRYDNVQDHFAYGGMAIGAATGALGTAGIASYLATKRGGPMITGELLAGSLAAGFLGAIAGAVAGLGVCELLKADRRPLGELDPRLGEVDRQLAVINDAMAECKYQAIDRVIDAGRESVPSPKVVPGSAKP
jgi:hypothetical protein